MTLKWGTPDDSATGVKALLCREYGEPDVLALEEIDSRSPGPGELRMRVRACGVNFPDILMIRGQYQIKPDFPFAPGCEVAGEVLEIGSDVSGFTAGDRIVGVPGFGGMQEEIVVRAERCLPIPKSMDFDVAAVFSLTYGTSYHALVDRARLRCGETVLVLGAAGGVGSAAVDIAQQLGARVIAAGGSDQKLAQLAKFYGVEETLNYSVEGSELRNRVKSMTQGRGADVIFDPIGGDSFQQVLRCVNWNGRILVIGFAADSEHLPKAPTNLLLLKGSALIGVFWGRFTEEEPERSYDNFKQLFSWYEAGELEPHISHRFPLERGGAALTALIDREVVGKCVVLL